MHCVWYRLDHGEWDSDDEYESLFATVERLNAVWQEVRELEEWGGYG